MSSIFLQNTLGGKKEEFVPTKKGEVLMYNCGPTVYNYAHIGNLRSYILADILRRVLEYNNYKVKQIINVTDIGHLSSDNDEGEDKMTKALKREGKPITLPAMREVANFYFDRFKEDLTALNILPPTEFPFASDHIHEDVDLIVRLTEKGYTYNTSDGIYFDTAKFPEYGKLGKSSSGEQESRIGLNPEKRNSKDFAVWKFNNELGYEAIIGKGFPGWHIECSAMALKYLGSKFDIHTGGIDHIPVHHNNEIAQSVCAGYSTANYWIHNAFLTMGSDKMAKSGDNFITLKTLSEKNIDPLALRYVYLTAQYSSPLQFSWEALEAGQIAWAKLCFLFQDFSHDKKPFHSAVVDKYKKIFLDYINDDLNTPRALALVWEVVRDAKIEKTDKCELLSNFDKVLGLNLNKSREQKIPDSIATLIAERSRARDNKDFKKSDEIRAKIEASGYQIKDTPEGMVVSKTR